MIAAFLPLCGTLNGTESLSGPVLFFLSVARPLKPHVQTSFSRPKLSSYSLYIKMASYLRHYDEHDKCTNIINQLLVRPLTLLKKVMFLPSWINRVYAYTSVTDITQKAVKRFGWNLPSAWDKDEPIHFWGWSTFRAYPDQFQTWT